MHKKGTSPDLLMDIIITSFIFVLIFIFFFIYFRSNAADKDFNIEEIQSKTEMNEKILVLLRSPVLNSHKEKIISGISLNARANFDKDKELRLSLSIPEKKEYSNAKIILSSGYGSNIGVIAGGADNIADILRKDGVFAEEISWEDIGNHHTHVFAGCLSPEPKNPQAVARWVKNGGVLITTDYSVELLEKILGTDNSLISDKVNVPGDEQNIKFTYEGKNMFNSDEKIIKSIFRREKIKAGKQATVLAEYTDLDYGEWGAPIYEFKVEFGKVIHFTGHLSHNWDLAEHFFTPEGDHALNPTVDIGGDGSIEWQYLGVYSENSTIAFTGQLNEFIKNKCRSFPCEYPIVVKGEAGLFEISSAQLLEGSASLASEYIFTDLVVDSYYEGDLSSVEERLEGFVNDMAQSGTHIFINMESSGKELLVVGGPHILATAVSELKIVSIPLIEPGKSITISFYESEVL